MVGLCSKQGTVCYVIKTMVSIKIELKCSSLHGTEAMDWMTKLDKFVEVIPT